MELRLRPMTIQLMPVRLAARATLAASPVRVRSNVIKPFPGALQLGAALGSFPYVADEEE